MKLLILGGTRFLGRHLTEQALAAGHQVTLLHRGRSNATLFAQAEHRIADRDDAAALATALGSTLGTAISGGRWDAAIDTSAYFPRQVKSVAAALAGRVGQYQLVSTISVYAAFDKPGLDETAPLATLADPTVETVTGETYGGLKALCEQAAAEGFGKRCLIARPGLLVGPHDPTGRFTWWAQRFARAQAGSTVLAPGDPAGPVQCIDARDAAAWLLLQAERDGSGSSSGDGGGIFNLTGPNTPTTVGALMDTARQTLAPAARLEWVDEAFLLAQGVAPWTDLPVWLPRAQAHLHEVSIAAALARGLQCRPLAQTLADTAAWAQNFEQTSAQASPATDGGLPRPAVGLSPEREASLLAAWAAQQSGQNNG